MVLTQRMITLLREKPSVDQEIKIQDKEKNEIGRIIMTLKFKANTFEQKVQNDKESYFKIDEDIRLVGKIYYDPYEDDPDVIKKVTNREYCFIKESSKSIEIFAGKAGRVRGCPEKIRFHQICKQKCRQ